jgi:hypothetical protein
MSLQFVLHRAVRPVSCSSASTRWKKLAPVLHHTWHPPTENTRISTITLFVKRSLALRVFPGPRTVKLSRTFARTSDFSVGNPPDLGPPNRRLAMGP